MQLTNVETAHLLERAELEAVKKGHIRDTDKIVRLETTYTMPMIRISHVCEIVNANAMYYRWGGYNGATFIVYAGRCPKCNIAFILGPVPQPEKAS